MTGCSSTLRKWGPTPGGSPPLRQQGLTPGRRIHTQDGKRHRCPCSSQPHCSVEALQGFRGRGDGQSAKEGGAASRHLSLGARCTGGDTLADTPAATAATAADAKAGGTAAFSVVERIGYTVVGDTGAITQRSAHGVAQAATPGPWALRVCWILDDDSDG